MAARDWSKREVELLVADYFSMLISELRGEAYSKTAHRQVLAGMLDQRTDGSIERKHQNVSSVLIELGHPFIDGYKPLGNYQALLFDSVAERLLSNNSFQAVVQQSVEAPSGVPPVQNFLTRWEAPPEPLEETARGQLRERLSRPNVAVNWLLIEAQNRSLGRSGEEFVLAFERARLQAANKTNLADRIEHVSLTQGDGMGFDIRSFETNGIDRFIEVKTTAYGKQIPFFLSRHELAVSRKLSSSYHLYRLFKFRKDPRLYGLQGALDQTCDLDPVQFSARVK
jgi:hypothetical protein